MPFSLIAEFREFFLRDTQVTAGPKPDQEVGFPTQYLVDNVLRYNRFLVDHAPSEDVITKLFKSLTFKKNVEDTATITAQGLVRLATDAEAYSKTNALSSVFANVVRPYQLPEIASTPTGFDTTFGVVGDTTNTSPTITNIADTSFITIGDFIIGAGIPQYASVISKTATTITLDSNATATAAGVSLAIECLTAGIRVKKYKRDTGSGDIKIFNLVEALIQHSLELGANEHIQLVNDAAAPGNNMEYATNGAGVKGWYAKTLPTVGLQFTNVDATTVTNGTTVYFDFSDEIPTGDYIASITFDYTSTIALTTARATIARDGTTALSNSFNFSGIGTLSEGFSMTDKISVVLGQMVQLKVANNIAGAGDISLGSPRVLTLIKI